eukprot:15485047-Alexandrium_andersonii.AAC.1
MVRASLLVQGHAVWKFGTQHQLGQELMAFPVPGHGQVTVSQHAHICHTSTPAKTSGGGRLTFTGDTPPQLFGQVALAALPHSQIASHELAIACSAKVA